MKARVLFCAATMATLALAAHAGTGIKYKGNVKIEGGGQQERAAKMSPEEKEQMRKMGMSFEGATGYSFLAEAADGKFKMTYLTPFMMFPEGSYMVGDAKAKMAYFVFPDKKQYIEMDLDKLGDMAKSMKLTITNGKCTVTPLAPKLVNGTLCTGKRIEVSYDSEATVMGYHNKSHEERKTDYYTTDKYDVLTLFGGHNWQNQGLVTGDATFDKEIAAKTGFLGFPMQVISYHTSNGKDQGTTTVTTSDVSMTPFLPGHFDLPAGYTKTDFQGMMMGGRPAGEGAEGQGGQPGQMPPNIQEMLKKLGK